MAESGPEDASREMRRLRDMEATVREFLRAWRAEVGNPQSGIAESVVTQHHINRLTELVGPLD